MSLSSPSFEDARLVIQDRLADAAHEALVQQALSASRRPLSMAAVHPPFVSVRSRFAGTRPRYAAVGPWLAAVRRSSLAVRPRLAAVRRSSLAVRPRLATALRALASRLDPSLALNA